MTLQLVDSKGEPFAWRRMGVELLAGPSHEANSRTAVECDDLCISDGEGYLRLSYGVAGIAGEARRDDFDVLRVYADGGTPGRYDPGVDPFRLTAVKILRPVNYVALGDSYSSGEAGRWMDRKFDGADLPGAYLQPDDTRNPADPECRRWDRAYSQVLNGFPFGGDLTVSTYACTGAITNNVFRADTVVDNRDDPHSRAAYTDRPSLSGEVPTKYQGSDDLQINANWEPRQAVSLGVEDETRSVDMVTVTIGGNDMRFSSVIDRCVRSSCDVGTVLEVFGMAAAGKTLDNLLDDLEDRLVDVYSELKRITRTTSSPDHEATVFVLGYPNLVPPASADLGSCDALTARPAMDYGKLVYDALTTPNPLLLPFRPPSERGLAIRASERAFIRDATGWVNDRVQGAARRAGVHFVDIAAGFEGHGPCNGRAWMNGVEPAPGTLAVSDRSFHPNVYGQQAYADILTNYITGGIRRARLRLALDPAMSEQALLTASGLPVNPSPQPRSGSRRSSGDSAEATGSASGSSGGAGRSAEPDAATAAETTILVARPVTLPADCALFAPGGLVTLSAGGFAAGSPVSLSIVGATATGTQLPALQAPSATADADGALEVSWMVPEAPAASVDPAPRWYFVEATGTTPGGDALAAVLPQPVVAYPGSVPCAADDAATAKVGGAARIVVSANDTAPAGGSLDLASIRVEAVHNGTVAVGAADGSVTYTPDPGFVGIEVFRYWIYDSWGVGVRAEVTVTVDPGCTITGTAGVINIEGTEAADVICVPDAADRNASTSSMPRAVTTSSSAVTASTGSTVAPVSTRSTAAAATTASKAEEAWM